MLGTWYVLGKATVVEGDEWRKKEACQCGMWRNPVLLFLFIQAVPSDLSQWPNEVRWKSTTSSCSLKDPLLRHSKLQTRLTDGLNQLANFPFKSFKKRTCHKQNLVQVANAPTQACLPTWPSSTAFLATPPALRHRRSPGAGSGSSLHLARGDAAHAAQGTSTGRGKCGGRTVAIGTPVAWWTFIQWCFPEGLGLRSWDLTCQWILLG